MSFRSRLLIAFVFAVLIPMVALSLFIRTEMSSRLTSQYERRVESLVEVIERDLARQSQAIETALASVTEAMRDDARLRRALVDGATDERRYLLDYADNAMRLAGLSALQIQDASGRILSSGHFRNEFDRIDTRLPELATRAPGGMALAVMRAPDAPFPALVRVERVTAGGSEFRVVGGVRVGDDFLARLAGGGDFTVGLLYPGGRLSSTGDEADAASGDVVRDIELPFVGVDRDELAEATIRVAHGLDELAALRRGIDTWFLVAVGIAAVLAVLLVGWLSSRMSRPLTELAEKTSRIDLDRLDVDFDSSRRDEIGALSRLLGEMTGRLRASAARIRDAERRATLGEMARQINHDIKNGLTPIRNVIRHLGDLAAGDPTDLPRVFEERRGTLDSSVSYLENLASNYARLSRPGERRVCDVNDVVRRVVADVGAGETVAFETRLAPRAPVLGDPLSLRRVIENLVANAVDSLDSGRGTVTMTTVLASDGDDERVRVTVADTGKGMTPEQAARIFDDFYTTKESGTGLGLSIVRRLVMDLDGTVEVESEPGRGTRFVLDLPRAAAS